MLFELRRRAAVELKASHDKPFGVDAQRSAAVLSVAALLADVAAGERLETPSEGWGSGALGVRVLEF
jgi:hypothetical protein